MQANIPLIERFANRNNINAAVFNLTSGEVVVLDLDSYISNKTIQVSTYAGGLNVQISLDGINFFPSIAISAVGIYPFPLPFRYAKLTASGNCSGVLVGSLGGGGSGSGGGGGGDVTSVNGQTGTVNLSSDDVPEGSLNLYYTNARALAEINSQKGIPNGLASLDGSGHVPASQLGALTTDEVPEGVVNLYFTNARAEAAVIVQTILSGDTSHASSSDALYTALAGKQATGNYITILSGDVSASGPGSVAATVNSVGGSSAANIHSAELAANAATNLDTALAIVKRDASGNFVANIITATLSGNASNITATSNSTLTTLPSLSLPGSQVSGNISGNAAGFTGSLTGDVTGTQGATVILSTVVTGKLLTGYSIGANTPVLATDSVLQAIEKLQGQISAEDAAAITALSGDVSATGPGAVSSTVNSVGGSSAANIHSAELAANAATNLNTASTIVKRDASGNYVASQATLNSLLIAGTAGAGFVRYANQSVQPATPTAATVVFADSLGRFSQLNSNGFVTTFDSTGITQNTVYTLRNVSGKLNMDSRMSLAGFSITTTPYTILSTDAYAIYFIDTTVSRTINLPTALSVTDRVYVFKDISGQASANNITIVPSGTDKIEGLNASFVYSTSYGALTLCSDASANWWMI